MCTVAPRLPEHMAKLARVLHFELGANAPEITAKCVPGARDPGVPRYTQPLAKGDERDGELRLEVLVEYSAGDVFSLKDFFAISASSWSANAVERHAPPSEQWAIIGLESALHGTSTLHGRPSL